MKNRTAYQICLILAMAVILVYAGPVFAQMPGKGENRPLGMKGRSFDRDGMNADRMEGRAKGKGIMSRRGAREPIIQRTDVNKDGKVTADEYRSLFTEMDVNENKIIAADEIPQGRQSAMLTRLDADKDGALTEDEFMSTFKNLDKNGDGEVTTEEIATVQRQRMAEKGQDEGRGKGGGKARRGMLASLDTDEDGQITQQEFLARFSDLDENGDGIINADEVSRGRTNSMLTRLDADKDGSISEKEYLATFEALDTDGNGIVGTDEIPPQASGMRGRQKGGK